MALEAALLRELGAGDLERLGDRLLARELLPDIREKGFRIVSNAGGVTIPDMNVVAAYLEEQGRDALRQTLQHEAFHQFAHTESSGGVVLLLCTAVALIWANSPWGGSYDIGWDSTRLQSNNFASTFNPQLRSSLSARITQPLLFPLLHEIDVDNCQTQSHDNHRCP